MRNTHPEIDNAAAEAVDLGFKALYAVRYGGTHVLINMGKNEIALEWQGADHLETVGFAALDQATLTLPPWSIAVLSDRMP